MGRDHLADSCSDEWHALHEPHQQHRLSLLVENLFDRDYTTSMTSSAPAVDNLGRPFTSEVRYTYRF